MASLVPAHGGLPEPLDCTVPPAEEAAFKAELAALPKVPVSDADLSTVYRFGDGALSPLTGPMDGATYAQVLDHAFIEHQGKRYAWTIPLAFPVPADLAGRLEKRQAVALVNSAGTPVARLTISDVFAWDKMRYLKSVYGTERTDHPGANIIAGRRVDYIILH